MAFPAQFMTFQKRVNSTALPGQGTTYQIELKDRTSIFNPVIILRYSGNPTAWNYCYIATFSRYYWINSWVWDSGLWYASCTIDVLATYHTDIGNSTLYVLRSASEYDGNVIDTYYPVKSEVYNTCSLLASPFTSDLHGNTGTYVIGILNQDTGAVGATSYYLISDSGFRQLCQYLFSLSYTNIGDVSANMQKIIFNPIQYIVSVMWLPFAATAGETDEISVGYWDTPITAFKCTTTLWKSGYVNIAIPKHPQVSRGRYLNLPPFSQYCLEFWPWGSIPIDATKIVNASYLHCDYIVDYITGVGNLRVTALDSNYASLGDGEVATAVAQVGVPIQMAQTSLNLSSMASMTVATGAAGNALAATKNALGAIGHTAYEAGATLRETGSLRETWEAIKSGFSGVSESAHEAITNIGSAALAGSTEVRTSGSNGGLAVLRLGVRVNAKFMYVATENLAYVGRPLCAFRQLNTLTGFCQVADGDIALAATAEEAQAVRTFLETGIYLEGYSNSSGTIVNSGDSTGESGGSGGNSGEVVVDDGGGNSGGSGGSDNGEIIVEG